MRLEPQSKGVDAGRQLAQTRRVNRANALERLAAEPDGWDVLIIGGGATGLGTAVDAAARGHRTVLLEQHDFAKGTSSRSTKLIHGGFRYLKQGNFKLVREALHERGLLRRNAWHLVHPLSFVVPAYGAWDKAFYGFGLKFYDVLAGRLGLGATRLLTRDETLQQLPTLAPDRLTGGIRYFDGQFDDARLAISLARTVHDLGGVAVNHCPVSALVKENGRVTGVRARDAETGREFTLRARVVVNATGVFTDTVRRLDEPASAPMVVPSQGSHLVLDRAFLPGKSALMVPKTDDGRVLFAIPWHNHVVVGTTDALRQDTPLEPRPLAQEIEFMLEHAGRYLTKRPGAADIRSAFAGLRPLFGAGGAGKTSSISREHALVVSDSGLVTITGGKWTTYRAMAEQTVDRAQVVGGLPKQPSRTKDLPLHGAGAEPDLPKPLRGYGTDATAVEQLAASRPEWSPPLHPNFPHVAGEVVWAARYEMARTVEDVLARRTRVLFLDARAALEVAPAVARLLARELGRDAVWEQEQVRAFGELARGYLPV
jgi:glycerol-3-phosphate dehydrogenase